MKQLLTSLLGALIGANLGALLISLVDVIQATSSGQSWWPLWSASVSLWYGVALLFALLVGVGTAVVRHPRMLPGLTRTHGHAQVAAVICAALLMSYATYGALKFAQGSFASPDVHAIFVGLCAPVSFLAVLCVIRLVHRWRPDVALPDKLEFVIPALLVLVGAGWIASFLALEHTVYINLNPRSTLPPLGVGISAALCASVWPGVSKRALIAAFILALPLPWGLYSRSTAPDEIETQLAFMANASGHLHERLSTQDAAAFDVVQDEKTASCFPDITAPALENVKPVDPKTAPNIIFLTLDAWRWDHTPWSGYKRKTMPNFEKFAKKGAIFSRAYTPSTSTRQTIGAYFTGVHTSQYKRPKTKRWSLALDKDQQTLASVLQQAGYHTVAINQAKAVFASKVNGLNGFEVIDNYPHHQSNGKFGAPFHVDRIIAHMSDPETRTQPKFIWSHLMEMHQVYNPGPKPYKVFGKKTLDVYDSAMHSTDRELERLFDFVRGHARKQNTYIIVTSDHGHAFKEHGKQFHGHSTYEEEVRVPLVIIGPGIEAGTLAEPINLLSVHPTILDIAGLSPSKHLCESSLLPHLKKGGPKLDKSKPIYIEVLPDDSAKHFMLAFIKDDKKLIVKPSANARELYDLSADPKERKNLAKTQPELLDKLTEELKSYQRARGIPPSKFGL